jgi:hypothetical protein
MSVIPVDLERRFEQRWAARFFPPVASATPQKYQQLASRGKGNRKTRRVGSAGLKSAESYRRFARLREPTGP